jgi:hypothetical protein
MTQRCQPLVRSRITGATCLIALGFVPASRSAADTVVNYLGSANQYVAYAPASVNKFDTTSDTFFYGGPVGVGANGKLNFGGGHIGTVAQPENLYLDPTVFAGNPHPNITITGNGGNPISQDMSQVNADALASVGNLEALTATQTVANPNGAFSLTAKPDTPSNAGLNVVDLTGKYNSSGVITLDGDANSYWVLRFTDTVDHAQSSGGAGILAGPGVLPEHIIVLFEGQAQLSAHFVAGTPNFDGTYVFADKAQVDSSVIFGAVIQAVPSQDFAIVSNAEVDFHAFTPPVAIPLPAAVWGGCGLLALAACLRRR